MQCKRDDEESRRAYWSEQMDTAGDFMRVMLDYPVEECGEPLVSLEELAKSAGVTVGFSRTRIAGTYDRLFYLREGPAQDFVAVAAEMNNRGWILKVEDGFRSRAMQKYIALQENVLDVILRRVIWEGKGQTPTPDFMFRRMTVLTATCPKIGTHMSGSAIDISVLSAEDHSELDRGGPYLELSELTPMASPFISAEATVNRTEITDLMRRHGFMAYPYEFWHYSKGDAYAEYLMKSGAPARYGPVDFDLSAGTVAPIANPETSLHTLADIEENIKQALGRLGKERDVE
ncbi:M15 family metallopeptidase [Verrucomicrobiota bacterium]